MTEDVSKFVPFALLKISEKPCGMSRSVSAATVAERPLPESVSPSLVVDTDTVRLKSVKVNELSVSLVSAAKALAPRAKTMTTAKRIAVNFFIVLSSCLYFPGLVLPARPGSPARKRTFVFCFSCAAKKRLYLTVNYR